MKPPPAPGKFWALVRGNHVIEVSRDLPKDTIMVCEAGPGGAWVPYPGPVAGGGPRRDEEGDGR